MTKLPLSTDADELASCVGCGLCLPHCPTYRVTGQEAWSPRGRIAAMRQVQSGMLPLDDPDFVRAIDTCVQCRGCETACPSGVPFGHLIEATRRSLVDASPSFQPWWRRAAYRLLGAHRLLLIGSSALAIGQRLRMVPSRRLGLPRLPIRRRKLVTLGRGERVLLYTGCVMDAWQRDVHHAVQRVLARTGVTVVPTPPGLGCCGALAQHAGLDAQARRLAERNVARLAGSEPILVDSAGCGAQLKEIGRLLGTAEAMAFSARVRDVDEWLAERLDRLPAARGPRPRVAVQDPCHLRHAQRAHLSVRTVLAPFADLVELDDEGLCCGAGGAFSVLHADLARQIRDRKLAAIARSRAAITVSANPGCSLHLSAAGVDVRHPFEIIDQQIGEDSP